MKELTVTELQDLNGGISDLECMIAGFAVVVGTSGWGTVAALAMMAAAGCFSS